MRPAWKGEGKKYRQQTSFLRDRWRPNLWLVDHYRSVPLSSLVHRPHPIQNARYHHATPLRYAKLRHYTIKHHFTLTTSKNIYPALVSFEITIPVLGMLLLQFVYLGKQEEGGEWSSVVAITCNVCVSHVSLRTLHKTDSLFFLFVLGSCLLRLAARLIFPSLYCYIINSLSLS